eukprot:TRINITY_DN27273_c0_g1_i2.p1 TRINITY_DN27273_c0_g1~~TRINITY_DN27273_c0_g1_i2.p1  ORF type:complete len:151 (+),score=11.30 TRINITY_DN27273_c0_g1_i2:100-552(+)
MFAQVQEPTKLAPQKQPQVQMQPQNNNVNLFEGLNFSNEQKPVMKDNGLLIGDKPQKQDSRLLRIDSADGSGEKDQFDILFKKILQIKAYLFIFVSQIFPEIWAPIGNFFIKGVGNLGSLIFENIFSASSPSARGAINSFNPKSFHSLFS